MILALFCSVTMVATGAEEPRADEVVFTLRMTEFPPVSAESMDADQQLRILMTHPRFSRAIGEMETLDGPVELRVWIREAGAPLPEETSAIGLHYFLRVKGDYVSRPESSPEQISQVFGKIFGWNSQKRFGDIRATIDEDGSLLLLVILSPDSPRTENGVRRNASDDVPVAGPQEKAAEGNPGHESVEGGPAVCCRTVLSRPGLFRPRRLRSIGQ